MVVEGRPDRYVNLFAKPDMHGDRYLKWCLTHNQALELENVEHFEVGLLATTMPICSTNWKTRRIRSCRRSAAESLHDGCRSGAGSKDWSRPLFSTDR